MSLGKGYQELAALGLVVRLLSVADEDGNVFATQDELAQSMLISLKTFKAIIGEAVGNGLVWTGRGKIRVNRSKVPVKLPYGPVITPYGPVTTHGLLHDKDLDHEKKEETHEEKKEKKKIHVQSKPRDPLSDPGFVEFWSDYPRKEKRKAVIGWWAKNWPSDDLIVDILEGLDRWRAYWKRCGTEIQFIPHPLSWLNGERWTEHPPV